MRNKHGVKFLCTLPENEELLLSSLKVPGTTEQHSITNEEIILAIKKNCGRSDFFGGTYPRQDCFYLHPEAEWWSYEVCINEEIRQFHLNQNHELVSVSSLGKFSSDQDWE